MLGALITQLIWGIGLNKESLDPYLYEQQKMFKPLKMTLRFCFLFTLRNVGRQSQTHKHRTDKKWKSRKRQNQNAKKGFSIRLGTRPHGKNKRLNNSWYFSLLSFFLLPLFPTLSFSQRRHPFLISFFPSSLIRLLSCCWIP